MRHWIIHIGLDISPLSSFRNDKNRCLFPLLFDSKSNIFITSFSNDTLSRKSFRRYEKNLQPQVKPKKENH